MSVCFICFLCDDFNVKLKLSIITQESSCLIPQHERGTVIVFLCFQITCYIKTWTGRSTQWHKFSYITKASKLCLKSIISNCILGYVGEIAVLGTLPFSSSKFDPGENFGQIIIFLSASQSQNFHQHKAEEQLSWN